jgi:O-antigen ligase
MSGRLDKILVFGLLAAIAFSALAYGATAAWSAAVLKIGSAVLLLMWIIKCTVDKKINFVLPTTALPILAFMAFGLLQCLAFTDGAGQRQSLSQDVESTRSTVTMLIALIILFMLAVNSLRSKEQISLLVNFLVLYGIAMAMFSLIQHFSCENCLYWTKMAKGTPFGSFPNRNHFAGYMELLMPVPLAILTTRGAGKWLMIYAFAAALTGTAAVVSLSRGGLLTIAAEIVFISIMSQRARRHWLQETLGGFPKDRASWSRVGAPLIVVLLIVAGVIWIGSAPLIERLQRTITDFANLRNAPADPRELIWHDTISLIKANPLFGAGIGAFPTAFPLYDRNNGTLDIRAAHNDYLQIVADAGIVGGLIGLWFLASVFRTLLRGTPTRDPFLGGVALGSGAAIFGILVHSLFDFNLQIPSNALLFLVFVAVSSQLSNLPKTDRRSPQHLSANEVSASSVI